MTEAAWNRALDAERDGTHVRIDLTYRWLGPVIGTIVEHGGTRDEGFLTVASPHSHTNVPAGRVAAVVRL